MTVETEVPNPTKAILSALRQNAEVIEKLPEETKVTLISANGNLVSRTLTFGGMIHESQLQEGK